MDLDDTSSSGDSSESESKPAVSQGLDTEAQVSQRSVEEFKNDSEEEGELEQVPEALGLPTEQVPSEQEASSVDAVPHDESDAVPHDESDAESVEEEGIDGPVVGLLAEQDSPSIEEVEGNEGANLDIQTCSQLEGEGEVDSGDDSNEETGLFSTSKSECDDLSIAAGSRSKTAEVSVEPETPEVLNTPEIVAESEITEMLASEKNVDSVAADQAALGNVNGEEDGVINDRGEQDSGDDDGGQESDGKDDDGAVLSHGQPAGDNDNLYDDIFSGPMKEGSKSPTGEDRSENGDGEQLDKDRDLKAKGKERPSYRASFGPENSSYQRGEPTGDGDEELDYGDDETEQQEYQAKFKASADNVPGTLSKAQQEEGKVSEDEDGEIDDDDDEDDQEAKDSKRRQPANSDEEEDMEDGEIADDRGRPPIKRYPCRFFMRGQCSWGYTCKFLHPGVNDKGNYSLIDIPGVTRAFNSKRKLAASADGDGDKPAGGAADEEGELVVPAPPEAPRQESSWERGLRQAREAVRRATRKKETEADLEHKKLNISAKDIENKENETKYKDPYYDDADDFEEELTNTNASMTEKLRHQLRAGEFENFEVRWTRENYNLPYGPGKIDGPYRPGNYPPPPRESRSRHDSRDNSPPYRRLSRNNSRAGRGNSPDRRPLPPRRPKSSGSRGGIAGGRADDWHDPWQRSRDNKGKQSSASPRHRRGSMSSTSSRSSYSSRSRSSSYSSSSSGRSSSQSSYSSRSRSRSRTPPPKRPAGAPPGDAAPRSGGAKAANKPTVKGPQWAPPSGPVAGGKQVNHGGQQGLPTRGGPRSPSPERERVRKGNKTGPSKRPMTPPMPPNASPPPTGPPAPKRIPADLPTVAAVSSTSAARRPNAGPLPSSSSSAQSLPTPSSSSHSLPTASSSSTHTAKSASSSRRSTAGSSRRRRRSDNYSSDSDSESGSSDDESSSGSSDSSGSSSVSSDSSRSPSPAVRKGSRGGKGRPTKRTYSDDSDDDALYKGSNKKIKAVPGRSLVPPSVQQALQQNARKAAGVASKGRDSSPPVRPPSKGSSSSMAPPPPAQTAPVARKPAPSSTKESVKDGKTAVSLKIISKPHAVNQTAKKRVAENLAGGPSPKKQAVVSSADRETPTVPSSPSISKQFKGEGKPPKPTGKPYKPPVPEKLDRVEVALPPAPPPVVAAAAAVVAGSSSPPEAATLTRREELLKQLRQVEDAIARKRSKV